MYLIIVSLFLKLFFGFDAHSWKLTFYDPFPASKKRFAHSKIFGCLMLKSLFSFSHLIHNFDSFLFSG